ncbi:hypothetical protein BSKO_12902 [Bryopsis sp. KO-2023]|nr:hypothetical protein BSKO_12902 [Bryopsis sp. KO-2023]
MASTRDPRQMNTREILDESVQTSAQNTDTMRRALQIVQDTNEVQAATLDALNVQGGQLRGVAGDLDEVHEGVDDAEEVLEKMRCCGFLRSSKPRRKKSRSPKAPKAPAKSAPVTNGAVKRKETGGQQVPISTMERTHTNSSQDPAYAQIQTDRVAQEDYLTMIDRTLDAVKQGAQDMGSELDTQNKYLENIQDQAHAVHERVDDVNRHAVIRRHVKR